MLVGLNALNQKVDESRELMIVEFKEIKEEMKSLNDRVSGVEAYVSEVRIEGDIPNVINLPQAQGRHDPVVNNFNLLATPASKVSEPVDKAMEEDKEKDAEEEQVDKARENEKEKVVVVEEEKVMEEDKREKKKSRKHQRKNKDKEAGSKKSTHVEE